MTDINSVTLVGRLTRPAELKMTGSGFAIVTFSLAVNRSKKDQNGQWQDKASFFDCKILGKRGESLSQYLVKGQQVAVQGYLEQESWESNGQKRSKVIVMVENLSLLGNKSTPQASQGQRQQSIQPSQNYQAQYNQPNRNAGPESFTDSDIPF